MADYGKQEVTREQLVYADWLNRGMMAGFAIMVLAFAGYVLGVFEPYVPVHELPRYWVMPAKEFLHAANVPHGWGWLELVGKGDFMNFIGIAFLASVTVVCYIRIVPILFANKDTIYGWIAIVEVVILILSASGILVAGH
jgi:hypothetical protein